MTAPTPAQVHAIPVRWRTLATLAGVSAVGAIAFFWPFFVDPGSVAADHATDAPWFFALLLPLVLLHLTPDDPQQLLFLVVYCNVEAWLQLVHLCVEKQDVRLLHSTAQHTHRSHRGVSMRCCKEAPR